jgi:hypothetical protein
MKIVNQTTDQIVLKEGYSILWILIDTAFFILGGFFTYKTLTTSGNIFANNNWLWPVFSIFGLLLFLFIYSITIIFDKTNNQIKYTKKWLVHKQLSSYAINDVLRIETRKEWRSSTQKGRTYPVLYFKSLILFKDGQELPLDHERQVSLSGTGKEAVVANQIATFLGVPFQQVDPPNISSGIGMTGTGINIGGIQL